MITTQGNTITIVIDDEELQDYFNYYFHKYPRRRKEPIDKPIPPSLNKWAIMKRPQANDLKQKWKEFIVWLIDKYKLSNKGIEKCRMTVIYTFPTRTRRDLDNYCTKFINDGLVESGFLADDSYFNIEEAKYKGRYEKGVWKTELIFEVIE